ncbi:roadblock/LC7 domain-containing protein [Streptomyces pactum]|uniref:roadblock/LC7 domain-containing protein n=1 Tax=Streptomyces pactum TaxID=68249 RepID=UPI0037035072
MTAPQRTVPNDMSWVLDPLLTLPGVRHGVVLTADGMVTGASPELRREAAEGTAAMMSALQGAARAVARELSGEPGTRVEQVVLATDNGVVFAVPAGEDTVLALFADTSCEMAALTHRVQLQVATLATWAAAPRQHRGSGIRGS